MPPSLPPLGSAAKVIVPAALGVIVLGVGGSMYSAQVKQTRQFQQQLATAQQQINQLQLENQDLTQRLQTLQAERTALDERVSALRAQLATASASVERTQVSLKELQDRHDKLAAERAQLQQQVALVTEEREGVKRDLAKAQTQKADAERLLAQSRERMGLLDRDFRKLKDQVAQLEARPLSGVDPLVTIDASGVSTTSAASSASSADPIPSSTVSGAIELPPIIVGKNQVTLSPPVRGRLMEVNREHNFIVVDKGSLDGVRMGMTFDILRSGSLVGRATVVRVRPQLSACDIQRSKTPTPVQVGDAAVQSGS